MLRKIYCRLVMSFLLSILLGSLSSFASAEIIDDITITTDPKGEVNAVIKFTIPIQYLRHFPQGKAPSTSIYFNILSGVPASEWQDYESRRTPPSDLVQDITVTTRDRGTGPKVLIKFYRPAEFTVRMGRNNQVLVVHVKPDVQQQKNENKPAQSQSGGGAASAIAALPATVLPAIAAIPVAATPSVSVSTTSSPATKSVAAKAATPAAVPVVAVPAKETPVPVTPVVTPAKEAPVTVTPVATPAKEALVPAAPMAAVTAASAPVAAAPVPAAPAVSAPVAPSGEVTAPKVVLATSSLKPIHVPLGGKDGLPDFPDIDQEVQKKNVPTTEKLSLADQINKANQQAGVQMEKGGRALLAGQSMVAIESFNNVLNLPPSKYTQDAQLWIGIARERAGQLAKAILEFNSYLKIYPDGKSARWVKDRLDRLKTSQPAFFNTATKPSAQAKVQNTELQYSEYGSLSMYYYQGQSQIDTTALAGTVQTPTSFSNKDQKSLMTNVTMTARAYNNEYDNRLVFQGFGAKNLLPGQHTTRRLGAAYYEMKDRVVNYSAKFGVQSGFGGGVMGRFMGISGGYGFTQDLRMNVVAGQLIDFSNDSKPVFKGVSMDFGARSQLGGSVYLIDQRVNGLTDRRAVGGNLRYFEQGFNVMSMLDYDVQFRAVNMLTVQGTLLGSGVSGTDFNFLLDRRRSPILDIRNAVNGTGIPIQTLILNGFTTSQLLDLAKQRTSVTNLAQLGMTNHLNEKWLVGTDFTVSDTSGLPQSGGFIDPNIGGCFATEGCLAATPSSGTAWTISERLTGVGIIKPGDVTNFSLSYTKSRQAISEAFQVSNHTFLDEKWTLDSVLHLGNFSDNSGGNSVDLAPSLRASYRIRNNLTADAQLGVDWTWSKSEVLQTKTNSTREFVAFGFSLSF